MSNEPLKPCPFCGADGRLYELGKRFEVICSNSLCHARPKTGNYGFLDMAVNAWNTRHDGKHALDEQEGE